MPDEHHIDRVATALLDDDSFLGDEVTLDDDWSGNDEDFFEYLHATGLPQKEILHHMSDYPDGQVRYRISNAISLPTMMKSIRQSQVGSK